MRYINFGVGDRLQSELTRQLDQAAASLHSKLMSINADQLGLSDYFRRYLGKILRDPVGKFQRYNHLLSLCIREYDMPLDSFVFIDYGGGTGMLSLLARELGIGTVIYNDIYDVSCADAEKLSQAVGLRADYYVHGDIDEMIAFSKESKISPNAVCSFDVIEHIYNIESFLKKLPRLSKKFRTVLASGANISNRFMSRRLKKIHHRFEFEDREAEFGQKKRDTLRKYKDLRRELIIAYAPELSIHETLELVTATRGLIREDIERSIDEYRKKGRISYIPDHPTNTCDPLTGNWAERLMKTEWLERILIDEGFSVEVLPGYWSHYQTPLRRIAGWVLNRLILVSGKNALFFSPHFILCADYSW